MRDPSARMPIGDADLEAALRDLGGALAIPSPAGGSTWLDPAARARARIAAGGVPRRWGGGWLVHPAGLPLRRALVLAAIAALAVAVIAGALGLGLPGIRIVQAPSASTGPTAAVPSGSAPSGSAPVRSASLPPGATPT